MADVSKIQTALARGVQSARNRRANKRAIKARRKVSQNKPGSSSIDPGMYGIGGPGHFGGGGSP